MGLFNKLKNVLFEDEEIVEEEIDHINDKDKQEKNEEKEDGTISDRELFKAEPTFNFPQFDEKEFDKNKKLSIEDNLFQKEVKQKPRMEYDVETKIKKKPKSVVERKRVPSNVETKKKFIPSPVISPVYGILDKNYKKEDVIVAKKEKPKINVDIVRRKAFGTLKEDIEKTLTSIKLEDTTPIITEEKDEIFTELLEKTIHDTIEIPEITEETQNEKDSFNIEEVIDKEENESESMKSEKTIDEQLLEDTLENDLFDLIDSMYENREDGE